MDLKTTIVLISAVILSSCGTGGSKKQTTETKDDAMETSYKVKLLTVDPGHFHAALVQKTSYPQVSPDVRVYAPEGPDVEQHLARIASYNARSNDPTKWNEIVYRGTDFFEKMLAEKAGNVVVLSGNNKKKASYITASVNAGLYDIMTERFEVTTLLQKLLSQNEEIFGTLVPGSASNPAVSKVSVHHFSKIVSGSPLQRPAWFFDVEQQGEGIVDVTTHLVDLVQWECFPEQVLDPSDVKLSSAKRWPTIISKEEFRGVTGLDDFPEYLSKDIKDGKLNVYSNGEMIYQLKGIWAKVSVTWNFMPPAGGGDTHYSVMRGTKCDLVIRQGADEKFVPTLYVENIKGSSLPDFNEKLKAALGKLPYDSLTAENSGNKALKIFIPAKYRVSHEEHFGQVTQKFLEYMEEGKLPEWEVPGMITKYYTTTSALKLAKE